jgi:hypothetical protein
VKTVFGRLIPVVTATREPFKEKKMGVQTSEFENYGKEEPAEAAVTMGEEKRCEEGACCCGKNDTSVEENSDDPIEGTPIEGDFGEGMEAINNG